MNTNASGLVSTLLDAARIIGAAIQKAPEYLKGDLFKSEMLRAGTSKNTHRVQMNDAPQFVEAVILDGFPVLIGVLNAPPDRESVSAQLRRYRNQATIARSWLGSEAPNLHLFLVTPAGAFLEPDWRQIAAEIEADDRVCRKLVWLLKGEPTADSAREFLDRTFIARPWPNQQRTERLDLIANFMLPEGWEDAIQNQELDFTTLVEQLIELQRGESHV
jgi:hypothetical protein